MEDDQRGYLIDSDVLIDHLRGVEKASGFLLELRRERPLWVSTINIMEVYSGKEIKNSEKRKVINTFLKGFGVIDLDERIAKRAGIIRADLGSPFADAAIAATCLEHNLVLVTTNEKHFKQIEKLALKISSYKSK